MKKHLHSLVTAFLVVYLCAPMLAAIALTSKDDLLGIGFPPEWAKYVGPKLAHCMGTTTANGTTAVTVPATCIKTGARVVISRTSLVAAGVTEPGCWATNIVAGTSFDLDCNDAAEDSTFAYVVFNAA